MRVACCPIGIESVGHAHVYLTSDIGPRGVVGLARVGMADPVRSSMIAI
jgi:hypothetical protein